MHILLSLSILVFFGLGFAWSDWDVNFFYENTQEGFAFYSNPNKGTGACSFSTLPVAAEGLLLVGFSQQQWVNSQVCGMCMQVEANGEGEGNTPFNGTYTAFVWDICPRCNNNGIDIPKEGDGWWHVSWKAVPCDPRGTNIEYVFPPQESPDQLKIQVRNVPKPVASMWFRRNSEWVPMERTWDNYFVRGGLGEIKYPVKIRMESIDGRLLEDTINNQGKPGEIIESDQQFDRDNSANSSKASLLVFVWFCFVLCCPLF